MRFASRRALPVALCFSVGCAAAAGPGEDDEPGDPSSSTAAGSPADGGGAPGSPRRDARAPDSAPTSSTAPAPGRDAAAAADGAAGPSAPPGQPPPPYVPPRVVISEIMYHPADESGPVEEHEFVEIANRGDAPVALAGWRLAAGVSYTFGNVTLAPRAHLAVAKNPSKLAAAHGLDPASVAGPYQGELDNGGETVALADATGAVVDSAKYDDRFPWPIGADGLGAGERWLPASVRPLSKHRGKGHSLERVSFDLSPLDVANWWPSPLDGATPGRPNTVSGAPPAAVVELAATAERPALPDRPQLIRSTDAIVVQARLAGGPITNLQLQLFVDDVEKPDDTEPRMDLPMTRAAGELFRAVIPPQKDNAIVRYRIRGDRGRGLEVISPRPTDPHAWHAAFVTPEAARQGRSPAYQLFVSRADWGRLYQIARGLGITRPSGEPMCGVLNARWNDRVPAVLVADGRVHDVFARYQGRGRPWGAEIRGWPAAELPVGGPSPLLALSWRFYLPRHAPLDGKRAVILNKLDEACQGFATHVGARLMEQAGVPAGQVIGYRRLFVNGRYYHYMAELEHVGEPMLARAFGKDEATGDLFKSAGFSRDNGPLAYGDLSPVRDYCGHAADARYTATFARKTPEWKTGAAEIKSLIDALDRARAEGPSGLRRFFAEHFDVKQLASYVAAINWMSPWDDFWQNFYLYRRPTGRWAVIPWDFDLFFGGFTQNPALKSAPWKVSFYIGEEGDPSNRLGWRSRLKDAFIKSHREELHARLGELAAGALDPANVAKLVDQAAAEYVVEEAMAAPSGAASVPRCGGPQAYARAIKTFAQGRTERVRARDWREAAGP